MRTLLTLDYELFFGRRTGTVARMTPYSLQRLEAFLAGGSAGQVSTFAPYRQKKEAARPEALAA